MEIICFKLKKHLRIGSNFETKIILFSNSHHYIIGTAGAKKVIKMRLIFDGKFSCSKA